MSAAEVLARTVKQLAGTNSSDDTFTAYAEVLLADLGAAGFSVVDLPTKDGDGWWPDSGWERWFIHATSDGTVAAEPDSGVFEFKPPQARAFAIALLAAADAAESGV